LYLYLNISVDIGSKTAEANRENVRANLRKSYYLMKKYSANNARLGGSLLGLLSIIIGVIFIILSPTKSIILFILFLFLSFITIYFAVRIFRDKVFDITFTENEIRIKYRYKPEEIIFSYSELVAIKITTAKRYINVFTFQRDNKLLKYSTNAVAHGEEYVSFIKQIKTINNTYKVYIYPKGTSLHRDLRRALLNVEE
jgi:hypothetical protein